MGLLCFEGPCLKTLLTLPAKSCSTYSVQVWSKLEAMLACLNAFLAYGKPCLKGLLGEDWWWWWHPVILEPAIGSITTTGNIWVVIHLNLYKLCSANVTQTEKSRSIYFFGCVRKDWSMVLMVMASCDIILHVVYTVCSFTCLHVAFGWLVWLVGRLVCLVGWFDWLAGLLVRFDWLARLLGWFDWLAGVLAWFDWFDWLVDLILLIWWVGWFCLLGLIGWLVCLVGLIRWFYWLAGAVGWFYWFDWLVGSGRFVSVGWLLQAFTRVCWW